MPARSLLPGKLRLHPGDGFQDFVRPLLIIRTHDNHTETVVVTFDLHATVLEPSQNVFWRS